ncbi:MAG: TetR family transcriptional regulator [Renibacterium sp.]|nr:TetR family transcriptional regulator [Renibacterium sp.]
MTGDSNGLRPRRGRRSGGTDTKDLILEAARIRFAQEGFDAVSLRQIARDAGVDAALVHHYFGSKDELFAACVALPMDPAKVLGHLAGTPVEQRAEVILRTILDLWDSPARTAMLAMVRSALNSDAQAALLRQVLTRLILPRALAGLDYPEDERELRGSLLVSQVLGLLHARHLLRIEPLASVGSEQIIRWVAPTLQRYLTGDVDGQNSPSTSPDA